MTMIVENDKFRVSFDYGEDRREPAARAYFGDKPIEYPPLEGAAPWPQD